MPKFRYKAIDDTGNVYKGSIIAFSSDDVESRLHKQGLTLIKSKPIISRTWTSLLSPKGVKPRILMEFYRRMAETLEMGLPILTAMEENMKAIPSKYLKEVIDELKMALEGGNTLHEAMSRFPDVFSKLDLGIIMVGEQSGVLPKCLNDLADYIEWKEDIKSIIKRATIYPAFILAAITGVIGIWIGYVLPRMAQVLKEMDVALPAVTKVVLNISQFFRNYWYIILIAILLALFFMYMFYRTKKGKRLFDRYILKAPLLGEVVENIALARLSQNFSTMYGAGMSINRIFNIIADNVIGNSFIEERLKRAYEEIQRGRSIAEGFENAGGFPPLVLGAIKNGEITGTLDKSMKRLGKYYDGEVKRTVQILLNAFEPITLFLLGGVFGVIILSILLPLYDVITKMGHSY